MLNPYRQKNGLNIGDDGVDYEVDGIDDKLGGIVNSTTKARRTSSSSSPAPASTTNSDWLASFGDVNRFNFLTSRKILMDGFVHTPKAMPRVAPRIQDHAPVPFTDTSRPSGPWVTTTQDFLNYYYYMASQFALSDRWFSPVASKSINNRIATFTGGTTQGLVRDPGEDHLPQLNFCPASSRNCRRPMSPGRSTTRRHRALPAGTGRVRAPIAIPATAFLTSPIPIISCSENDWRCLYGPPQPRA